MLLGAACTVVVGGITALNSWWSPYQPIDPQAGTPRDFTVHESATEGWAAAIIEGDQGIWTYLECFDNLGQRKGSLKFKAPFEFGHLDGLPDAPGAWFSVGWRPDPASADWTAAWLARVDENCVLQASVAVPVTWGGSTLGQATGLAVTSDGRVGTSWLRISSLPPHSQAGLVVYDPATGQWDGNLDVGHASTPNGTNQPILRHDGARAAFAIAFGNDITELDDTTLEENEQRILDTPLLDGQPVPLTTWDVYGGYTQAMFIGTGSIPVSFIKVFDPMGSDVKTLGLPLGEFGQLRGAREATGPSNDMKIRSWVADGLQSGSGFAIDSYETQFSLN